MKNKIDLEKILSNVDKDKSPTAVAFKSEDINFDLESIKEALKVSDKIFLEIGYFNYDENSFDEPYFIFDGKNPYEDSEYEYNDDFEHDEYYKRYKSGNAKYGIYLDRDLNVEYGYSIYDYFNGEYRDVFHDFKEARDADDVKIKISTILANADIWITADVYIDDFNNKCDLEKLVEWINENSCASIFAGLNDVDPIEVSNTDLNSIKKVLNNHDKIFVEIGDCGYFYEYSGLLLDTNDVIGGLKYEYYDKYNYEHIGYGIYLDKDLNVEYGYYVNEFSRVDCNDHKIFHNFEDARDDDEVKIKLCRIIDQIFHKCGIWNIYEVSTFPKDKSYCPNCGKKHDKDEKFCTNCRTKLITGKLVNDKLQAEQELRNSQIIDLSKLLDDASIMASAYMIIPGSWWVFDSKENILIDMLKRRSFDEIIKISKNISPEAHMFFKSFNDLDIESAQKFFKDIMGHGGRWLSKEIILKDLLIEYNIKELHEKLRSYTSFDN